jgi:hypothetical protein
MAASSGFVGTPTVAERLADPDVLWKSIVKRVGRTLRVAIPGKILAFDSTTQYVTVQLGVTENIILNEVIQATPIPILKDVLLLLPGDSEWSITFPSIVGSECLVHFADMCISGWAQNGGVQNQIKGVTRRHSLSDGFAVLSPRSQQNVIADYSTSALEIRNLANTVKIALSNAGISFVAPVLKWNQPPAPSTATPSFSIPITLDGTIYYLLLSPTP